MSDHVGAVSEDAYVDPRAAAVLRRYEAAFGGGAGAGGWSGTGGAADAVVAGLPIPVERIAEDLLGLEVRESDGLGEASGLLVPRERRVWLAGDEPAPRKRFTLAHEIGHWVCQCREGRAQVADVLCREVDLSTGTVTRALEREANIFAAELLMPRAAVRAVWEREQDVAGAAARFAVSDVAMGWRLYALGHVAYKPV